MDASTSTRVLKKDSTWEKHGWWLKSNASGIPELWITIYPLLPNHTICGLGKEIDTMVQLSIPNPATTQWLHITAQIERTGTSKYKLDRRLIMLHVPENLVKQPTHRMKGFATLAKLWLELSDDLKEQRLVVVERAFQLDNEGVLKAHRYWKEAQAYHEQAQRASTSSSAIQAPTQTLKEPEDTEQIYRVFARPVADNWTPPTTARRKRPTTADVPFDLGSEPYPMPRPSNQARRLRARTQLGLKSSQERRNEVDEVEPWQGEHSSESEDIEEDIKKRKRKDEELPFPTVEEINEGFIWGQDCVFNVPIARVHPAKDVETNHRVFNIHKAKETYNRLLGDFWNDVSHVTLRPMGHVTELRQEDGTMKLLVCHFQRFHEREDFEAVFQNHQDEGNPLSRTDFLMNNILWQHVDGQHIIHACKVLAREAFERGDITEEIYREQFHTRKARFVVYYKPHLYIGASVQINELHLKRAHYNENCSGFIT